MDLLAIALLVSLLAALLAAAITPTLAKLLDRVNQWRWGVARLGMSRGEIGLTIGAGLVLSAVGGLGVVSGFPWSATLSIPAVLCFGTFLLVGYDPKRS